MPGARDYPFGKAGTANAGKRELLVQHKEQKGGESAVAVEYNQSIVDMGDRIRARREELGMSAAELAVRTDMDASALSRIESGQRAVRTDRLIKIAAALKTSLANLQPSELDQFSDVPAEMLPIIEKLQKKSLADQKKLIQMFASMVDIM